MKKHLIKISFSLGLMLGAFFLVRCGQPYCLAGLGNCSAYSTGTGTATATGGGGSLTIAGSAPNFPYVSSQSQLTLTVTGGQAPYTLSLNSPPAATQSPCSACFSPNPILLGSNTATLTAPPQASSSFSCPIATVTDSNQRHYCTVSVLVKDVNNNYGYLPQSINYYIDY